MLFNGDCFAKTYIKNAAVCCITKGVTNSKWDHVGLIVSNTDHNPMLLDMRPYGVSLESLEARLRKTRCQEIAIRKVPACDRCLLLTAHCCAC